LQEFLRGDGAVGRLGVQRRRCHGPIENGLGDNGGYSIGGHVDGGWGRQQKSRNSSQERTQRRTEDAGSALPPIVKDGGGKRERLFIRAFIKKVGVRLCSTDVERFT
jgi:hypothetical protein